MSKAISTAIKMAAQRVRYVASETKRHTRSATTLAMHMILKHLLATGLAPELKLDESGWTVRIVGNCAARTLALAIFLRHGYKPVTEPQDDETYYCGWMRNGAEQFWFTFSNNACERVKVGTKWVEQDVYETRCTD